jgi:hypothetical protein
MSSMNSINSVKSSFYFSLFPLMRGWRFKSVFSSPLGYELNFHSVLFPSILSNKKILIKFHVLEKSEDSLKVSHLRKNSEDVASFNLMSCQSSAV